MDKELDLTTSEGVVELMRTSKSEEEWNNNCDKVKAANGKDYPAFWYESIMLSGVAYEVMRRWKK